MNIFGNIFAYIELAAGAVAVVGSIQHLVNGSEPLTGQAIVTTISPVIMGIQMLLPKLNIPSDLVLDVANAAADSINRYYKKIV